MLASAPRFAMVASHWVLPGLSFVLAWWGTAAMRKYARSTGLLDVPNERSSHSMPTPRGGGLAIATAVCIAAVGAWFTGLISASVPLVILVAGGLVATVGYLDDRYTLPAILRFVVHTVAAIIVVVLVDVELAAVARHFEITDFMLAIVAVVGVVWMINLYNFMDGIDGLAAAQATFMAGGAAVLNLSAGGLVGYSVVLASIALASCGFLVLNWPPAKIFMGDAGSGFIGLVLGALALVCDAATPVSVWAFITLGSLFIGDATATLLRRVIRGERWYVAHRSHAYQALARRFGGHRPVTLAFLAINVLVVFPAACLAVAIPAFAPTIAFLTVFAAGLTCLMLGAGSPDAVSRVPS